MSKTITNSFHSSSKNNSIKNSADLQRCQKHNFREFSDPNYDAEKIVSIIGSDDLVQDTKAYIDDFFEEILKDYNESQTRNDRKIYDAFEYFSKSKKVDLANEVIFQFGDLEFWKQYVVEEIPYQVYDKKNDKILNKVRYVFDTNAVSEALMIHQKQIDAYEHIYEDCKNEILDKIKAAKRDAIQYIENCANKDKYKELINTKDRKQHQAIWNSYTPQEKQEYAKFYKIHNDLKVIDERKLIEHTENNDMTIKVTNAVAHVDEHSIHSHAISVCSIKGTERGLSTTIAKSTVLNKWSLEVIQNRMRQILKEEIDKSAIFNAELTEKSKGRNHDFTVAQLIKNKRDAEIKELNNVIDKAKEQIQEFADEEADNLSWIVEQNTKSVSDEIVNVIQELNIPSPNATKSPLEIIAKGNFETHTIKNSLGNLRNVAFVGINTFNRIKAALTKIVNILDILKTNDKEIERGANKISNEPVSVLKALDLKAKEIHDTAINEVNNEGRDNGPIL